MKYHFETDKFGLSDEGVHLLRSRYNYKTIPFREIDLIDITKGRLINNWLVIMAMGVGMIAFSVYYSYNLYLDVVEVRVPRLYVESFVLPIIPVLLGSYCLWASSRSAEVMKVTKNGKVLSFPVHTIQKENQLEKLYLFLSSNPNTRGKVRIGLKSFSKVSA